MTQSDILKAVRKMSKPRRLKLLKEIINTFRVANNETYLGIVERLWKEDIAELLQYSLNIKLAPEPKPIDWIKECTKIGKMYEKEAKQQWKQNPCVKYTNRICPKISKKRNYPKCKTCGVNIIL